MVRLYSIFICVIVLAGFGCKQGPNNAITPDIPRDRMSTYQQFVKLHAFPYTAPKNKQGEIKRNYSKLSLGLSKSEVINIIGSPDYSEILYSKESNHTKYLGSSWVYYFEKQSPTIVNEKTDKRINVFFNTEGKTHWIISDIDGLTEIEAASSN
jgi:hypothetical protein